MLMSYAEAWGCLLPFARKTHSQNASNYTNISSLAKFLFLVTFLNLTFTYGVIPLLGEAEWVEEEEEEEEE